MPATAAPTKLTKKHWARVLEIIKSNAKEIAKLGPDGLQFIAQEFHGRKPTRSEVGEMSYFLRYNQRRGINLTVTGTYIAKVQLARKSSRPARSARCNEVSAERVLALVTKRHSGKISPTEGTAAEDIVHRLGRDPADRELVEEVNAYLEQHVKAGALRACRRNAEGHLVGVARPEQTARPRRHGSDRRGYNNRVRPLRPLPSGGS